jgi:hypothetical protein
MGEFIKFFGVYMMSCLILLRCHHHGTRIDLERVYKGHEEMSSLLSCGT